MTIYNDKKDDTLVELTLLGNEKAYEELVRRHEKAVLGTAYKVTENRYSAEDASQDAFVSAWVNLDSLRDREKFGSWVCSIAKNHARNLVVHYKSVTPDISLDLLENTELTADESFSELVGINGERERDEKLRENVEALSEKIREVIKLHYFDGLSVEKISEKLALPAGTVKWRLSEGRKQLRKEYGIMEKTYNENESLVERVMRQVEELKLWRLKNDKSGFEDAYRAALASVETLDDSKEKSHALADVLLRGYLWLPGEKNEEVFARIKQAAIDGHNDDVMQSAVAKEHGKLSGHKKRDFMRNKQIPELMEQGFVKSAAYVWFWLGYEYLAKKDLERYLEAHNKVIELLEPTDVYYANALAALKVTPKYIQKKNDTTMFIHATGEVLRYIDGKLYFWSQPGYSQGKGDDNNSSLFWNCSLFENIIFDPDMKVGQTLSSSDRKDTLTLKEKGVTVTTPAGIFENCCVTELSCDMLRYVKTYFCEGVGIVKQKIGKQEWVLSRYQIKGGDGIIPFYPGNRWEYDCKSEEDPDYEILTRENVFEVTAFEKGSATIESYGLVEAGGYKDTWRGNLLRARQNYYIEEGDKATAIDVMPYMRRAAELAETKREKLHTEIASDVMERIIVTEPNFNPDYTQKGRWNFFTYYHVKKDGGKISIPECDRKLSFEWKNSAWGENAYKVLHNFLYDILDDAAGCVWSDEWVSGYEYEKDVSIYSDNAHVIFKVLDDETVETPAGRFENCRHIFFGLTNRSGGWGYRGGKKEYWFAEGVGIVKMSAVFKEEKPLCVWELTEYRGKGEGFFPIADGLFRRYEPSSLGHGYHASVEYNFDEDENGIVIFRNALGTQDRKNYEMDLENIKRKEEEKKAKESAEKE